MRPGMQDRPPPAEQPGAHARPFGAPAAPRQRPVPLRAMGIGELIDASIRLYRAEWKVLMGIVAFVWVPLTFIEVWVTQLIVEGAFTSDDAVTQLLIAGGLLLAISVLFVQPFLVAAITRAAADIYLGEPVGIGKTYRFALGRVHSILWITILSLLATLAGFILLVIPGIFVFVRLAFASAVLVIEDRRGTKALGRSWRLARGHFWRILGTILLAGIIAAVVAAIVSIPGEIAVQAIGPDAWPISTIFGAFASILTTPFTILVIVLLYFDLRIRKEGFDIEVMAQELAAER
jgi:hypothetical protein